jgi:hypothetical protein
MTAETLIIDGCAIATVDDLDQEYASGHLVIRNGRIDAVGDGPAPAVDGARAASTARAARQPPGL